MTQRHDGHPPSGRALPADRARSVENDASPDVIGTLASAQAGVPDLLGSLRDLVTSAPVEDAEKRLDTIERAMRLHQEHETFEATRRHVTGLWRLQRVTYWIACLLLPLIAAAALVGAFFVEPPVNPYVAKGAATAILGVTAAVWRRILKEGAPRLQPTTPRRHARQDRRTA